MIVDDVAWTSDAAYALGTIKHITWITGTWPLQEGRIFSNIRFGISLVLGLGVMVSLLKEIQLSCGNADETLDFLGVLASTIVGLTKVILVKIHREDLGNILSSALKDWSNVVDGSTAKDIMQKYARRARIVCRVQIGCCTVVSTAMILDALPESSSMTIPLRTMCTFGNMSTSTYWTVFVLQGFQIVNSAIIDYGNDSFFFGVAMYICGQFDVLVSLYTELGVSENEDGDDRDRKITEFIDRHSYLMDLARRLRNTLDNILLVLLMADGLHICILGIQMILLLRENEIIPFVKSSVAFFIILAELFVYCYTGDYLSTLSQNIQEVVYDFPWYEFPSSVVRNLMFIMKRAHVPLCITAGRFYIMNMDSFKNILKASFSYFSVLRIMFEE